MLCNDKLNLEGNILGISKDFTLRGIGVANIASGRYPVKL